MLPTTGFFKDIDCPYYDSSCGRPYCHFRHRKRSQDRSEQQDEPAQSSEIPTYKPTPKSQLANTRSHIPISYVPDLVIRADRNMRLLPSYNYADKPTYKPTPLSELSKANKSILMNANKEFNVNMDKSVSVKNDVPNEHSVQETSVSINFEDLSTEFEMIDDIINDDAPKDVCNKQNNKPQIENCTTIINDSLSSKPVKSSHKSKDKNTKSRKRDSKLKKSECKPEKTKLVDKDEGANKSIKLKEKNDRHEHKHDHKKEHKSSKDKKRDDKRNDEKGKRKSDKTEHKRSHSSSSSKSKHREKHKHKDKERISKDVKDKKATKDCIEQKPKEEKNERGQIQEKEFENVDTFSDDEYDLDEPSLEEECYRIFNEYKPEVQEKDEEFVKPSEIVEEYVPSAKKRVAYHSAEQYLPKIVTPAKLKPAPNAGLVMASRLKIARLSQASNEQTNLIAELNKHNKRPAGVEDNLPAMKFPKICTIQKNNNKLKCSQSSSLIDDIINGKSLNSPYNPTKPNIFNTDDATSKPRRRIAPVQNVNSIQQAKAKIEEIARRKAATTLSKTPTQTVNKGSKRLAHVPDMSLTDIPDVLQPDSKKIPMNVRTRYLTMIADECMKLYLIKQDAYERALNEELKVLERCAAINTYRNSAMLAVNRIRKEFQEREMRGLGPISSDESNKKRVDSNFTGIKFYHNIFEYILNEEDLETNGYPRESTIHGRAVMSTKRQTPKVNLDENQRLCCRCYKVYLVDEIGIPLYEGECIYHPLKKRTIRGERIYLCCKSIDDTGCVTSNTHVSESEEAELDGFQATMNYDKEDDPRNYAVYALDCEMCYTTKGLELTRVTIIDSNCKIVYETFVKPLNPIIDYNTRFSGITKDQMDKTSTSILQVQANILHLCNSKTILIGHSLESDLKALKIIHSCVIDTSILFPHRLGLPHKRALRTLASEYLKKIIQSDVAGHDSAEDALTCMELVIWKLKEDLKVRKS